MENKDTVKEEENENKYNNNNNKFYKNICYFDNKFKII